MRQGETKRSDDPLPGRRRPVIVGQAYAVPGIADPVHETQGWASQNALKQMILDYELPAAYPSRFAQQSFGFLGVVDHIDQHDNIELAIGERYRLTVEAGHWNVRLRANQYVKTTDSNTRLRLHDAGGEQAVPAADVQDSRTFWQEVGKVGRQHMNASTRNMSLVKALDNHHISAVN